MNTTTAQQSGPSKIPETEVLAACNAYDAERTGEDMAEYPAMYKAIAAARQLQAAGGEDSAPAVGGHTVGEVITANDGRKFKFLGYGNYEELPSKTAFVHGPAAPVVGFVVVPRYATHEMCEAAHFGPNCAEEKLRSSDREFWEACWTAMVEASPAAQSSAKDGVRVPKKEYCPVTDWDGMPVEEDGWQLDVLVKLREALPTVGLNGWTTGVDVLSWAIERLQATTASGLVGGVVSDAMVVKALGVWFQDPNYQRDVADHVPEQVTRMRAALQSVWPGQQGEGDDYVLIPRRFHVDADAWEAVTFAAGGPSTGEGELYMDSTLWVGQIEQDDGSKVYGLHVSCNECPEEGSITLATFPAQPPAGKEEAAIGREEVGNG